tara:strand:+ start:803 stop:2014 length:1212 start_codon:yes stop_codon:yes gene_type:complete
MKINKCRVCKSTKLTRIFTLGNLVYTGIFPKYKNTRVPSGNLSLIHCRKCKLLQLEDNFNSKIMYGSNYGYMSSLNSSMEKHLKVKSKNLIKKYKLNKYKNILDIGSNDGTFLKYFSVKNKLFACDPTIFKFKKHYKKNIKLIPKFFSSNHFKSKKFNLVSSIAMFYDLPNPLKFAKDVKSILDENGIWHIELSYMPLMLNMSSYDTICHEHLEYYSLTSLKYMMDMVDLKIINISFNDINGGSIAMDIARKSSYHKEASSKIKSILHNEKKKRYNEINTQKIFFLNCKKNKTSLIKLLKKLKQNNKLVYGYGASTKGNVILQYCKIKDNLIPKIAEINKFKYNKYTPGTKIKIISESEAKSMNPDYYLVLPWHFKKSILKREKIFLKNGGKMIFPIPKIQII